jgi:hypothetical protein
MRRRRLEAEQRAEGIEENRFSLRRHVGRG